MRRVADHARLVQSEILPLLASLVGEVRGHKGPDQTGPGRRGRAEGGWRRESHADRIIDPPARPGINCVRAPAPAGQPSCGLPGAESDTETGPDY